VCLDLAQLQAKPFKLVHGCCKEACSTYIDTSRTFKEICCPTLMGAQTVVTADGTKIRVCCADGSIAQPDGTCCRE
jgi:hypothetical protein